MSSPVAHHAALHAASHVDGGADEILSALDLAAIPIHSRSKHDYALIPSVPSDPVSPADGDIWYNSTDGRFKMRLGGVTYIMNDWNSLFNKPSTFPPSAHASYHHSGGADALALGSIAGQLVSAQHPSGLGADLHHAQLHKDSHKSSGGDAFLLTDLLDCLARLEIKLAGTSKGKRRGLNFIQGANVTLTVADDATNEEVDVTIAAAAGGGAALPSHISFLADGANVAWTNQPAALTEFLGATRHRTKDDLTNAAQVRLVVNVMTAGAATPAKIRAQYSTDLTNWYYLDGTSGPSVDVNTTGLKVSAWVNLASGAKADVYLRIVGIDGNGAADPAFGNIQLQFK